MIVMKLCTVVFCLHVYGTVYVTVLQEALRVQAIHPKEVGGTTMTALREKWVAKCSHFYYIWLSLSTAVVVYGRR